MNKEQYIEYAKKTFNGKSLEIILNQIELFFTENVVVNKNHYKVGENVKLIKGTFIHGISGGLDNFDWTVENGFVSSDFNGSKKANKFFNNVGMWNIQKDCMLIDYIKNYSGVTLGYTIGRGPESKKEARLIPYQEFEKEITKINNDENIWMWNAEQTKEIRFIPSLASNKIQIAFIINMDSEYAKKLKHADIFNSEIDKDVLKYFIVEQAIDKFMNEERDAFTTDRESAIMFGLPIKLVEGVLIGRKLENNNDAINHIKSKLPDCYICNLDGKVICGTLNSK